MDARSVRFVASLSRVTDGARMLVSPCNVADPRVGACAEFSRQI